MPTATRKPPPSGTGEVRLRCWCGHWKSSHHLTGSRLIELSEVRRAAKVKARAADSSKLRQPSSKSVVGVILQVLSQRPRPMLQWLSQRLAFELVVLPVLKFFFDPLAHDDAPILRIPPSSSLRPA